MAEMIGYSAYNVPEDSYEYNENECFIADSIESLRDFIEGAGFPVREFRAARVLMSDIMDDYGASSGRYCMEPEALKRFEKAARAAGIVYALEDCMEGLVNVEIDLSCRPDHLKKTSVDDKIATPAPKIHKIDTATLVSFSSQKNRFLMATQYCTNPSCPKNDIYLSFMEVDDRLNPVADPLSFTIRIDLDTGEEINPPKRQETVSLLVEEFLNGLTEEMKEDFLSVIHFTKNEEKRLAEYRLNRRDVIEGLLVAYTDIISEKGSIIRGGQSVSFRFLHKGQEYLVEDLYCPNPSCNCNEVHLDFFRLSHEITGKAHIADCFMAIMSLKGRMQVADLLESNTRDAKALMREWKTQHPYALDLLKERYEKIKEIGERSVGSRQFHQIPDHSPQPGIRGKKIGRNEPCPCGSGKKYKKCCGAS